MAYFQAVCAGEFSLFFELPTWEAIVLQGTLTEPALHHAALAIGALARRRYHPDRRHKTSPATTAFAIQQYSRAIQGLYGRLDETAQSLEVAVVASVVFSYIEFLLGLDSRIEVHVKAGCAMLENLRPGLDRSQPATSITEAGRNSEFGSLFTRYDLLANAMFQLTAQVNLPGSSVGQQQFIER
ncbi:hypothetical protein SPI_03811 [Niveomyces insectorum RCEF 264]|uniref:Uncharacterized protein n=1 Tax=Niveomyces insectorum RCEF 264 TaxID=1081102 RepID=A0A167WDK1_9HYPO|nr:hypothetical protein SPI_03811 [Niveomyces insectorum RCEF 264]